MNKYYDSFTAEDAALAAESIDTEALRGKTVFITGATGLIGSQICRTLLACSRQGAEITVIAYVRNADKAAEVFADQKEDAHLVIAEGGLDAPISYEGTIDYIIHTASPTGSRYFVEHPVETIHTAIDGTDHVLRLAREHHVEGMVYLSSLEVYGTPRGEQTKGTIKEDDAGYIDSMSVRSSYSEGKRLVECLCASYAAEYGVPVRVARLSQTFGPGVQYDDGRVFAEFARDVIEGKDIVLHTQGKTVRSYCYVRDAVTAILTILTKGKTGEAYNVTNMDTACSIYEMACLTAELYPDQKVAVRIEVPEDLASFGYNPEMVIRLDSGKLNALGWKATAGLEEMFDRLIRSMKERR